MTYTPAGGGGGLSITSGDFVDDVSVPNGNLITWKPNGTVTTGAKLSLLIIPSAGAYGDYEGNIPLNNTDDVYDPLGAGTEVLTFAVTAAGAITIQRTATAGAQTYVVKGFVNWG